MTPPLSVSFLGGEHGAWKIERLVAVRGHALHDAPRLAVLEGPQAAGADAVWAYAGSPATSATSRGPRGRHW